MNNKLTMDSLYGQYISYGDGPASRRIQEIRPFEDVSQTVLQCLPFSSEIRKYIHGQGYRTLYQLAGLMLVCTVVDNMQQSLLNLALRLPNLPPAAIVDMYHMFMYKIDEASIPGIYDAGDFGCESEIREVRIANLKKNLQKVYEKRGVCAVTDKKKLPIDLNKIISGYL